MAQIVTKAGTIATIGSGYPTLTSWGDALTFVDPGTPLRAYSGSRTTDPLAIWKKQPALRKVVSFAARQVASVPWHEYERVNDTDRKRQAGGPVESVLSSPAPLQDGFMFWNAMATDLMIYDLCCAILVTNNGRDELIRIPPGLIVVESDKIGRAERMLIKPTGSTDDEVDITDAPKIATWGWHPTGAGGVSPMHTLAAILEENLRSVEWRSAQWQNSPKMSGIITRPKDAKKWNDLHKQQFMESWRKWKSTPNAGGTPILEDGMQYEKLDGVTPKDAQDIEGRILTDAEVASAFHIPPELVGARAGNFSNIDAFRQMLWGPTLGPLIKQLQQAVNHGGVVSSLDSRPGVYVEANLEAMMAGSFLEQARVMQTAVGGPWMTRAEGRARMNLPYIPGTDELVTPLNVTEGGQASPTDSGSQNLGGDNAAPEERLDQ